MTWFAEGDRDRRLAAEEERQHFLRNPDPMEEMFGNPDDPIDALIFDPDPPTDEEMEAWASIQADRKRIEDDRRYYERLERRAA